MNGEDPRKQALLDQIDRLNVSSLNSKIVKKNKEIEAENKKIMRAWAEKMFDEFQRTRGELDFFAQGGTELTPEQAAALEKKMKIVEMQREAGLYKDLKINYREPRPIEPYRPDELDMLGMPKKSNETIFREKLRLLGVEGNPIGRTLERVFLPTVTGFDDIDKGLSELAGGLLDLSVGGWIGSVFPGVKIKKGDIFKGAAYTVAGGLKAFINLMPAVVGLNASMPLLTSFGRIIDKGFGGDGTKGEKVVEKLAPFLFGKWVGIGSIAAEEVDKLAEQSELLKKLFPDPESQMLARELLSHIIFFGTILAGHKVQKKFIDPYLDKTFPYTRGKILDPSVEKQMRKRLQDLVKDLNIIRREEGIKKAEIYFLKEIVNIYDSRKPPLFTGLRKDIKNWFKRNESKKGDTKNAQKDIKLLGQPKTSKSPESPESPTGYPPTEKTTSKPEGPEKPIDISPAPGEKVKTGEKPAETEPAVEPKLSAQQKIEQEIEKTKNLIETTKSEKTNESTNEGNIKQLEEQLGLLERKRDALFGEKFETVDQVENALEYFKGKKNISLTDYEKSRKRFLIKERAKLSAEPKGQPTLKEEKPSKPESPEQPEQLPTPEGKIKTEEKPTSKEEKPYKPESTEQAKLFPAPEEKVKTEGKPPETKPVVKPELVESKEKPKEQPKQEPEEKPKTIPSEQTEPIKSGNRIPKIPSSSDEAETRRKYKELNEKLNKLEPREDAIQPELYKQRARIIRQADELEKRIKAFYQEEFNNLDDIIDAVRYIQRNYDVNNLPPGIKRRYESFRDLYNKFKGIEQKEPEKVEKKEEEPEEDISARIKQEQINLAQETLKEIPELEKLIFSKELPKDVFNKLKNKIKNSKYYDRRSSQIDNAKRLFATVRDYLLRDVKPKESLFENLPDDERLQYAANYIDRVVELAKKINAKPNEYVGKAMYYLNENPDLLKYTKDKFKTPDSFREHLLKQSKAPVEPKQQEVTKQEPTKETAPTEQPPQRAEKITTKQKIVDTPIKNIKEDVSKFQGRDENYSMNSFIAVVGGKVKQALEDGEITEQQAKQILEDANQYHKETNRRDPEITLENLPPKRFYWNEFGQVALWKNKAGELFVLSGHSRFNSSKFLSKYFPEFEEIPTVIYEEAKGISFEEAQKLALESNYLQTKQSLGSNIKYLQQLRANGIDEKRIKAASKQFFGKEGSDIYTYSFLNPNGYMFQALTALEVDNTVRDIAKWIGKIREIYRQLTDSHENELYQFLVEDNTYKTRFKNMNQFIEFVERKTQNSFFDSTQPLNLKNITVNPTERYFKSELSDLKEKLRKSQDELQKKAIAYKNKNLPEEEINKRLKPILDMINRYTVEIAELEAKAKELDSSQINLFESEVKYKLPDTDNPIVQDLLSKYQAFEKRELSEWEKYVVNKNWVQGNSLSKFLEKEWENLQSEENIKKYILSKDSEAITKIIEEEIAQAEEQGRDVEILRRNINEPRIRNKVIEVYQKTQLDEIKRWFDYLNEQQDYDLAFKYSIMKHILAYNYDANKNLLTRRNEKTVKNFIPLNQAALGVIHSEFKDFSENLAVAYVKELARQMELEIKYAATVKNTANGKWLRYKGKENDPDNWKENASQLATLVQNTIWCTKTNARAQLENGDFYVYVTQNESGEYFPRIAIRMEGNRVAETRGILKGQTIEEEMLDEANQFLKTLEGGEEWIKNIEFNKNVRYITTAIENKTFTKEDINILLEVVKNPFTLEYENIHLKKLSKLLQDKKVKEYLKNFFGTNVLFIGDEYSYIPITKAIDSLEEKTDIISIGTKDFLIDLSHPKIDLVNSISGKSVVLQAHHNKPVTLSINADKVNIKNSSDSKNNVPINLKNSNYKVLKINKATVVDESAKELKQLDINKANVSLPNLKSLDFLFLSSIKTEDVKLPNLNKAESIYIQKSNLDNLGSIDFSKTKYLTLIKSNGRFIHELLDNVDKMRLDKLDLNNISDIKKIKFKSENSVISIKESEAESVELEGSVKYLFLFDSKIKKLNTEKLNIERYEISGLETDKLVINNVLKLTEDDSNTRELNFSNINEIVINNSNYRDNFWETTINQVNFNKMKVNNSDIILKHSGGNYLEIDGEDFRQKLTIYSSEVKTIKTVNLIKLENDLENKNKINFLPLKPHQDKISIGETKFTVYNLEKDLQSLKNINTENLSLRIVKMDTNKGILPEGVKNLDIIFTRSANYKDTIYLDNKSNILDKFSLTANHFKIPFILFKNKMLVKDFRYTDFEYKPQIIKPVEIDTYKTSNLEIKSFYSQNILKNNFSEVIQPHLSDKIDELALPFMPSQLKAESITQGSFTYDKVEPLTIDIKQGSLDIDFILYNNIIPIKLSDRLKEVYIRFRPKELNKSVTDYFIIPENKTYEIVNTTPETTTIRVYDKSILNKELEVKENAIKYVPESEKSTKLIHWFEDSKIKNNEGSPLVVYSAQNNKLQSYDPEKSSIYNFFGRAFYSTTSKEDAEGYKGKTVEKLGKVDDIVSEIESFVLSNKKDNPEDLGKLYRKLEHLLTDDIRNIISLLNYYVKQGQNYSHLLKELKTELLNQMSNDSVLETYIKLKNPLIVNPIYKRQNIPYENRNNWQETLINLEDLRKISSLKPTVNDTEITSSLLWKELEFNNKTREQVINDLINNIYGKYGEMSVPASAVIREMMDYFDLYMPEYSREFIKSAIATLGYDGIVMVNANENFLVSKTPADHIIAFYPNQIKSTKAENFADDNLIYNEVIAPYSASKNKAEEDAFYNKHNTHPYFRNLTFKISNKVENNLFGEVNTDFNSQNHIDDIYVNLTSKRPFVTQIHFELNKDKYDFVELESLLSKLPLQESKNINFIKSLIKDLTAENLNKEFAEITPYFDKPTELSKQYVYNLFDNYVKRKFPKYLQSIGKDDSFYKSFRDSFVNNLYDYVIQTPAGIVKKFDDSIFNIFSISGKDVLNNLTTKDPIIAISPDNIYVIDSKDTKLARLRNADKVNPQNLTKAINKIKRTKSDIIAVHTLSKDNLTSILANKGKMLAPSIALVKRSHNNSISGLMVEFSGELDNAVVLIGSPESMTNPNVVIKSRDFYSGVIDATPQYQMQKDNLVGFISEVVKQLGPEVYSLPNLKGRIVELTNRYAVNLGDGKYEINALSYFKIINNLLTKIAHSDDINADLLDLANAIVKLRPKVENIEYETDSGFLSAEALINKLQRDKEKIYSSGKLLGMLADTFNGLEDVKTNKDRLANRIFIDNKKYEELMQAIEKTIPGIENKDEGVRRTIAIKEWIDFLDEANAEGLSPEEIVNIYKNSPDKYGKRFGEPTEELLNNMLDFVKRAKEIKTDYFEAKAYEELPLSAFSHAIVSDKFPNELVEKLEEHGVMVVKFDSDYGKLRPEFIQSIADKVAQNDMFDNYNAGGLFGNPKADKGENIKERRNLSELLQRKVHLQLVIENAKTMGINNLMPNTNKTYGEAMLEATEELNRIQKSIDKLEQKLKSKISQNQTDLFGGTPDENTLSIINKPKANPKKAIDDELRLFQHQLSINFDNPEESKKIQAKIDALNNAKENFQDINEKDVQAIKISERNIIDKLSNWFKDFTLPINNLTELNKRYADYEQKKQKFFDDIKNEPFVKANKQTLTNLSEQYDNLLNQLYNFMNMGIDASQLNHIELRNYRIVNTNKIDINKLKKAGILDTTNQLKLEAIEPIKSYEELKNYKPEDAVRFLPQIADTFDFLNDEAVEHSYIFVLSKGQREPIIFQSATGTRKQTYVNIEEYLPFIKELADKDLISDIYFIHNHPSGHLLPSPADFEAKSHIQSFIEKIQDKINVHGIIIDKKRGLYTYFGNLGNKLYSKYDVDAISKLPTKFLPKSYRVKLPRFLDKPFIASQDPTQLTGFSPNQIAAYMYNFHYSNAEKSYLLGLNNHGAIVSIIPINLKYLLQVREFTGESNKSKFNNITQLFGYLQKRNQIEHYIMVTMNPSTQTQLTKIKLTKFSDNTRLLDHIMIRKNSGNYMEYISELGEQIGLINLTDMSYKPYDDLVRDAGGGIHYFGDTYEGSDGLILRDSIGDYNKFEKAMDELKKQMPTKLSPEEETRLKYLSNLYELTDTERQELAALRNKKKNLLRNDPIMKKRLSTWVKDKIRLYKKGYKDGQVDFSTMMRRIEQDIVNYAREVFPKYMFRKSEVVDILVRMKEARDVDSLEKALNKIDVIAERVTTRNILANLNKVFKGVNKDAAKKGIPNSIINIARAKSNKEKLEQLIQKLAAIENQRALSNDEQIELYFATKLLNLDNMSIEDKASIVKEIQDYVKGAKTKFQEFLEQEKARKEVLKKKAIGVITGFKGVMDEDAARLKKLKEGKPKYIIHKALQYDNMMHSFEWLMDALSKFDKTSEHLNSFLNTYFADRLQKASIEQNFSIKQYKELIKKGLEESFGLKGKELYDLLDELSEIKPTGIYINVPKGDDPSQFDRKELIMSQNEIAKMIMEYEDPTLLKTFEAMHIEAGTIAALRKYIDPRLNNWIKWQRKFYNEYYLTINDVYNKVRGYDLPYNPYYTPIQRDVQPTQLDQEFLGDNFEYVSIYNGHLQPRVSNVQPLKRQDINVVLLQHIIEMEHFKHYAEIINDLRAVFNSKEVRKAVSQYHDPFLLKVINKAINDFARGGQDHKAVYTFVDVLRSNFAKAKIGLNPVVMIKQLTSFPAYMMEIPIKNFFAGLGDFMLNPVGKAKFLYNNSKYLQTRYSKGWEREVVLALSRAKQTFKKQISGNMSFTDFIMLMTKMGDGGAIVLGGWGTYKYWLNYYKSKGLPHSEAHKRAIFEFEKATKRSQQSGEIEDLGEMQRGGSWATLWTLFKTAPKSYYSSTSGALRNLYYGRGSKSKLFKRLLVAHFVLPVLFQYASDGFQANWKKLLRAAILGSFNGIFILGDVLEIAAKELFQEKTWEYEGNPIESIAKETINATKQISKTINREEITIEDFYETINAISIAVGSYTGIPYFPLYRVVSGTQRAIENPENTNPLEVIGFSKEAVNQQEEKNLSPKVRLINEKQQRLNKLKEEARETLNKETIQKAKELQKEIETLKESPEWKEYLDQKKEEREQDIFYEEKPKKEKINSMPNFKNNFMPKLK